MRRIPRFENRSENLFKNCSFKADNQSHEGIVQNRLVLGDLTNGQKREFTLVAGDAHERTVDDPCRSLKARIEEGALFREVGKGAQNLVKEKEEITFVPVKSESLTGADIAGSSYLKDKLHYRSLNVGEDANPMFRDVAQDTAGVTAIGISATENDCYLNGGNSGPAEIVDGDVSRESCVSSVSISGQCEKNALSSFLRRTYDAYHDASLRDLMQNYGVVEPASEAEEPHTRGKDEDYKRRAAKNGWCSVPSNETSLQFIGSQESAANENINLASETANHAAKSGSSCSKSLGKGSEKLLTDLIGECDTSHRERLDHKDNACSCSYCLKAAYVWSELHYEDAKGRLAEVKKSIKQVRLLIGRGYSHGALDVKCDNSEKSKKIELDLMHHWRSLFLHTEDALGRERNLLQSSLMKLKELKENCKKDLEMIHGVPLRKL